MVRMGMSWRTSRGGRQWISMSLTEWLLFGWILFMGWLCWQMLYWTFWLTAMMCLWTFKGPYLAIRAAKSSRATAGRRP